MTSKLAYEKNLIDHHVILETSTGKKIVGTLISLSSEIGKIKLIGEWFVWNCRFWRRTFCI